MTDGEMTLLGLVMTFAGLIYTGEQIRRAKNISQGEFLLKLDDQFHCHDDPHSKLRPGGKWSSQGKGPKTAKEWILVEKYMGLFERIYVLVESGIISKQIVNKLYGYRITNIVTNEIIYQEKLVKRKENWVDFIALAKLLERLR
jgi:hypothetical protein